VSLSLRDVSVAYDRAPAISGVDLDLPDGQVLAVLGPSGSGKSTLLRAIAGLEPTTGGTICWDGQDLARVPTHKRGFALMFQDGQLFGHLSVAANVAYPLRLRHVPAAARRARVAELLDLVGLTGYEKRLPATLSGGERQRVALARALAVAPRLLLLDEPLSALDAKVRVQLRDEIRRIQLRLGITTVFVTHDQEEALAVSDRIAVMNSGGIEQIGSPEQLYTSPATAGVAAFVGLSSVISGVADGDHVTVWGQRLPLQTPADGPVDVYIRPENVRFAGEADAATDALVEESTFLGSMRRTLVRTESGELIRLQHAPGIQPAFGDRVRIALAPEPVAVHPRG